jgi:hypothetical protein
MNIFCDFLLAKYGEGEEGPDFLTEVFLEKKLYYNLLHKNIENIASY